MCLFLVVGDGAGVAAADFSLNIIFGSKIINMFISEIFCWLGIYETVYNTALSTCWIGTVWPYMITCPSVLFLSLEITSNIPTQGHMIRTFAQWFGNTKYCVKCDGRKSLLFIKSLQKSWFHYLELVFLYVSSILHTLFLVLLVSVGK